jgi:hypothetical protein
MKRSKYSAVLLGIMAFGIGCGSPNKTENTTPPSANHDSDSSSLCTGDCEGVAYSKIINRGDPGWNNLRLQPEETDSLKHALRTTPANGTADRTHIHADAVNGKLMFSSENPPDPTHVAGGEPQISFDTGKAQTPSAAVKIVATPAAAKLLRERSKQP